MNTDAEPSLAQMLDWLDRAAERVAADGGKGTPHQIVWEAFAIAYQAPRMRFSAWVMDWVRYVSYASLPQSALALGIGSAARRSTAARVGKYLGRPSMSRETLRQFKRRVSEGVLDGLRRDHGLVPSARGGFELDLYGGA